MSQVKHGSRFEIGTSWVSQFYEPLMGRHLEGMRTNRRLQMINWTNWRETGCVRM